jgi:hypothetical protein
VRHSNAAFSLRCQGKKPELAQSEALRSAPLLGLAQSEAPHVGGFLTHEKRRASLCAKLSAPEWRQREEGSLLIIVEIILERAKATPALQWRALTAALPECL